MIVKKWLKIMKINSNGPRQCQGEKRGLGRKVKEDPDGNIPDCSSSGP